MNRRSSQIRWSRLVVAALIGAGIGAGLIGILWVLCLYVPLMPRWTKVTLAGVFMCFVPGMYRLSWWLVSRASDFPSGDVESQSANEQRSLPEE